MKDILISVASFKRSSETIDDEMFSWLKWLEMPRKPSRPKMIANTSAAEVLTRALS